MRVSVVLCTHTLDRYDHCVEAAENVLEQTHDDVELVLVADGNDDVCSQFRTDYGDNQAVRVECLDENVGLLEARNAGAQGATGDVVAFLDDDAIPEEDWVERLVAVYDQYDVRAVGGRMTPAWVAGKPGFLPAEFYWLVGVTHRGFGPGEPDEGVPGEVRNTFGSNLSFDRETFLELGGFEDELVGRQGSRNLQGGETELCARLRETYGQGVYYTPEARVAHKIFEYRTGLRWLLDRAFWQGYSKRGMEVHVPASSGEETAFLGALLTVFVPSRLKGLVTNPSVNDLVQLVMLFVFTATVGAGYLYGRWVWG
jgi:glycosyltransferase involved in cell wall biosynthesis